MHRLAWQKLGFEMKQLRPVHPSQACPAPQLLPGVSLEWTVTRFRTQGRSKLPDTSANSLPSPHSGLLKGLRGPDCYPHMSPVRTQSLPQHKAYPSWLCFHFWLPLKAGSAIGTGGAVESLERTWCKQRQHLYQGCKVRWAQHVLFRKCHSVGLEGPAVSDCLQAWAAGVGTPGGHQCLPLLYLYLLTWTLSFWHLSVWQSPSSSGWPLLGHGPCKRLLQLLPHSSYKHLLSTGCVGAAGVPENERDVCPSWMPGKGVQAARGLLPHTVTPHACVHMPRTRAHTYNTHTRTYTQVCRTTHILIIPLPS